MLNLIFAPAGYGKTEYIKEKIQNFVENENKEVVYLVAEQISFESEREILRLLGAKNLEKVEVLSFSRFCDRFFEKYGGKQKRRIDQTGKVAMMELATNDVAGEISLFKRVLKSSDFTNKMLMLSEKLKRFAILPHMLTEQSQKSSGVLKSKLYECSLILSAYEQQLQNDYYDPLDDLTLAAKMLNTHNYFENKIVIMDSFNGFTEQQLLVVEKAIALSLESYITLCFDGYYTADRFSLFSNVSATAERIKQLANKNNVKIAADVVLNEKCRYKNEQLRFLERNFLRNDKSVYNGECDCITLCSAHTVYDECDYAASTIHRLVRTKGYRWRDFAVITRNVSVYDAIIENAFNRYNIPCFIDSRRSVESMAVFKLVYYAVNAALNNFSTPDILAMLKTTITDIDADLIEQTDNYAFIWKVNHDDWKQQWTGNPNEPSCELNENDKVILEKLNNSRKKIAEETEKLKIAFSGNSPKAFAAAIYKFVKAMGCDKNIKQFAQKIEQTQGVEPADRERRSYDLLISILDQLVMALEKAEMSGKKFFEMYCSAVAAADIGSLPQGLDEVSVGAADRMRPKSPKVTFILGAANGLFPAVFSESGIFSDSELKQLAENGIELPFYNEKTAADENFLAYTSVCSSSEKLYVCFSSAAKEAAQTPSVIWNDILEIFPNCKKETANSVDFSKIENTDTAVEVYAKAKFEKDYKTAETIDEYFHRVGNHIIDNAVAAMQNQQQSLSPKTAKKLYGTELNMSASRIDTFYHCAFRYFCQYGIRAKKMQSAEVDIMRRGSLVHYALEKMFSEYKPQQIADMSDDERFETIIGFCKEFLADIGNARTFNEKEQYALRRLALAVSKMALDMAKGLINSSFSVDATELKINSEEDSVTPFTITLSNGSAIRLSGVIDRVDIYEKNNKKYIRIVDYKTGDKTLRLSEVLHGQNLQMLIYMMALQNDRSGRYGKDIVPAGIFYQHAVEPSASSEKTLPIGDYEDELSGSSKLSGIVLDDEQVFNMMEHGTNGVYTSVKLKEGGEPHSSTRIYTAEQFDLLTQCIEKLVEEMGESLYKGKIAINPLAYKNEDACKYCDYSDVCCFNGEQRSIAPAKDEDVYKSLSQITKSETGESK